MQRKDGVVAGDSPREDVAGDQSLSRRGLFTKAAGVAAAAAAGGIVAATVTASPAGAATGDNLVAGQSTSAEATTEVLYDGASGFGAPVFLANDSNYTPDRSDYSCALAGWAGYGDSAGAGGVANGVFGYTDNPDGYGVIGLGGAAGVYGSGGPGPGVWAAGTAGPALKVDGKLELSRSGVATVAAHEKQVAVALKGLTSASSVIATVQGASGGIGVASVVVASGKFTIQLTGVVKSSVKVAWLILN
jgi:hypothetical protein